MEGQHFVLTGIDANWYGFACLACKISAKTTTCVLFFTTSWYFTEHCFWLRNTHYSKRSVAMGLCSWNSLVLPCSSPSGSSWVEIMVKQLFEVLATALSGNALRSWGEVLPRRLYLLWLRIQNIVLFFHSQYSRTQESRGGNGSRATITHSESSSTVHVSSSCDLMLCWPTSFSTRRRKAYTRRTSNELH